MKSNSFRIISVLLFLVVLLFLAYSCKKDPYQIGSSLLPPSDTLNIKATDTASFVAYSVLQDSVRTDETKLSILGSLMDPVFGSTTAGFYMQYRLSAEAPDFGINPSLDSIVLMMPYGTVYGDTNALQTVKIYELSQSIYYDSSYYSNRSAETYGIPLANCTFKYTPRDSVKVAGVETAPHIRISLNKLTNYFGNKLLNAPTNVLSLNTNFLEFMKGLYIESARVPSGGAIFAFDPTSSLSKIVMYFHNATDDSLHFDFVGTALSARFNHFDHNQYLDASPGIQQQVIRHDTTLGKNNLYIQGLGGIRVRFRLPFLDSFGKAGKIAINNAVLTIHNFETDTTLAPPVKLTLVVVDSAGQVGFLIDENEGTYYFGGAYNTSSRSYQYRITRHIQQVLDGKLKNYDMYLMANDPTTNVLVPNRVMLTGTNPQIPSLSADRISLQIVYTKLH
ncbi:MAG: DUF4270 domain-containing protein [Bacteroidetes bacterium]|nr:DUF4270 domain-containing protein [Bacteroidota bacterium]